MENTHLIKKYNNMTFNYKTSISKELAKYLKEYTTEIDVAKACEIHNVGFHTLRRLRLGETTVANQKNADAITELMRTAIRNADRMKDKAVRDRKQITKILDCV